MTQQSSALLRRFAVRLWAVCGKCSNMLIEVLWHGGVLAYGGSTGLAAHPAHAALVGGEYLLPPPPHRAGLVPW